MQRAKRSSSRHSNRSAYLLSRRGRRRTVSSLAQRVRLPCACAKPRRSRRIFTWRSRPRIASKSNLSIARLWRRVAKTMVRLVCGRTTTRITTQLLSLARTGTTSNWFATNPRSNASIEGTSTSGLRPLAPARHVKQGVANAVIRHGCDRMSRWRIIGLSVVFLWFAIGGVAHFVLTDVVMRIVPPSIPWPRGMVLLSGAFEMLGAAGLLWQRSRRAAGLGLFALTVAVTPAHFYMLQRADLFDVPYWVLVLRLPVQVALLGLIAWSTASRRTASIASQVHHIAVTPPSMATIW